MKKREGLNQRKVIAAFRRSGMSAPVFCRKEGIHFTTLYKWMRQAREKKPSIRFRRLKLSPLAGFGESVVAELGLANGTRIRVMRGCPEEELATIVEIASRCGN